MAGSEPGALVTDDVNRNTEIEQKFKYTNLQHNLEKTYCLFTQLMTRTETE